MTLSILLLFVGCGVGILARWFENRGHKGKSGALILCALTMVAIAYFLSPSVWK